MARLKPPKAMHVISDTDHFFVGYEDQVAALIVDFVGAR
jgi:alpha/beta superfamily hydrolase